MALHTYQLIHTPGCPSVDLRELNGHDELMIDPNGTRAVLKLLRNVITSPSPDKPVVAAEKIVISDRDYLLSGIYIHTYGPRIQSVLKCYKCSSPFDVDFSLDELVSSIRDVAHDTPPDEKGYYSDDEFRFRLPDGEDELAVAGMPIMDAEKGILERCTTASYSVAMEKRVQSLMKSVAPLLFSEMKLSCPECGGQQAVTFDMQAFLLSRMKNERKRVAAEIHSIATAYHWSHSEILEIPRKLRRMYAGMIGLE